jgi:diguanylate cyclase (GGDEF)-like protein/PAS domain S-box-containing protein
MSAPAVSPAAGGCPGGAAQRLRRGPGPTPAVLGAGACHSFACAILDGLAERMAVLAIDGTIVAVNRAWRDFAAGQRRVGAASLHTDVGSNYLSLCRANGADGAAAATGIGAVLAGGADRFSLEYQRHEPEHGRWFRMEVTPLGYGWGGAVVAHHDITAQRDAEAGLRIAAVAIDSFEGMMITDAAGTIVRVNSGFTRVTGYGADEAVGRRPSMLSSGRHDAAFYQGLWDGLGRDGHWQGEIWNRRKSGEVYPEYLSITAVRDAAGVVGHYVAVLTDITQRKADHEAVRQLAFHDPLTQLPNRRLLLERLQRQLRAGAGGALLFIDLDKFKSLNDRLGHDIGDLLLLQVARRLRQLVRETDTVARLGGDEFVVLCDGLDGEQAQAEASALGRKLLAGLGLPYLLDTHVCHSRCSIGVALFRPGDAAPADDLLKQADTAMYQAKQAGGGALRLFDEDMRRGVELRALRQRELCGAIAQRRLALHYQLQVGDDGAPRGAVALLRRRDDDAAPDAAARAIDLERDAGWPAPLGEWVLEQACAQLLAWQAHPVLGALSLSLPFDAEQWRRPGFEQRVGAAVARHGIDAGRLRLELPQSLLLCGDEDAVATVRALGRTGVRFALDGVGTGYASLRQLRQLPLDQLKLDAGFVAGLGVETGADAAVGAIVALGRALGLEVVAEGVATPAQRDRLQELGCRCYQGGWHSPPLPLAEFEALALSPAMAPILPSA